MHLIPLSEKTCTSKGYRMTLFCSGKNLAQEKWDGAKCVPPRFCPLPRTDVQTRTGLSEATAIFGADDARSIDHFNDHLRSLTPLYSNIYTDLDVTGSGVERVLQQLGDCLRHGRQKLRGS